MFPPISPPNTDPADTWKVGKTGTGFTTDRREKAADLLTTVPSYSSSDPLTQTICDVCGTVITRREVHANWHAAIARLI